MGWRTRSLVAALLTAAVSATGSPAAGQPPPGAPGPDTTASAPPGSGVVTEHTVTLVTGDVVSVYDLADGRQVASVESQPVRTYTVAGELYVVPDVAVPYLSAGLLDRDLFNVTQLVEQGYADERTDSLPLIVSYGSDAGMRTRVAQPAPAGATRTFVLESIDGAAWRADKDQLGRLWDTLSAPAQRGGRVAEPELGAGLAKVWLAERVEVALADSVPQVGAPEAWELGFDGTGTTVAVLDTGVDTGHPDLAGQIAGTRSFVPGDEVVDQHGHGTHVAATVAGTGAASGGSRRGVAPGADLLIGKVLNDAGSGINPWIIEGMEWAVEQGADVVSMSLGGPPSDGTDPLSMAVNNLSRSSDTLFVVAAGNLLPWEEPTQNISQPGAADLALTVGAVDKSDQLASFSHVGPRLGDFAIKPEITAPGVGIIAARAEGTSLGEVVDENYTSLNGTSMATPHVAGAAAILAQQHPDWTGQQIKHALVTTAETSPDYTVYQQGGGRLDVARAVRTGLAVAPTTLNLGFFRWPHGGRPEVTRPVTYTNPTDAPITLNLAVNAAAPDGNPAPDGMFAASTDQVTVPAGGTAQVDVTLDPNLGGIGSYSGYLVASTADGSTVVHTSLGATKEREMHHLTIRGIARDGDLADFERVLLWSLETGEQFEARLLDGVAEFRLEPGHYFMVTEFRTLEDGPNITSTEYTAVTDPDIELTEDTELTYDARDAVPVEVDTPRSTEIQELMVNYARIVDGLDPMTYTHQNAWTVDRLYALPTEEPENGGFEFSTQWALMKPDLIMRLPGGDPIYQRYTFNSPKLDGRHRLPVVDAGDGTSFEGVDVAGKVALMSRTSEISFTQQVANAHEAGAVFAVVHNDRPGRLIVRGPDKAIPVVTIYQADGQAILDRLADGPVTLELDATAHSPYVYDLFMPETPVIPDDAMSYEVGRGGHEVARVEQDYYGHGTRSVGEEALVTWRPWRSGPYLVIWREMPRPFERTQWISADTGDGTTWRHFVRFSPDMPWLESHNITYEPGERTRRSYFEQVMRPGIPDRPSEQAQLSYREGDAFRMTVWPFVDADGNHGTLHSNQNGQDSSLTELYRDGELVATKSQARGSFPAVPERARYELTQTVDRDMGPWLLSTHTETTWTFWSQRPDEGEQVPLPLLQVDYDLPLNLTNQAGDRRLFLARLDAHHQQNIDGPRMRRLSLEVSYDDGATWHRAPVIPWFGGERLALIWHPSVERTSGYVSLRVHASDADGNRIDQTIIRAYALR